MKSALRLSLALVALLLLALTVTAEVRAEALAPEVSTDDPEIDIQAAVAELAPADRALADAQRWCAVMPTVRLGAMGKPVKITLEGKSVLLCCAECEKKARANTKATVAKAEKLKKATAAVAKLSPVDRKLADAQRFCAVQTKSELGSMGTPVKLLLEGQPVFLCCAGCKKAATANPKATLAKLKERAAKDDHEHHH